MRNSLFTFLAALSFALCSCGGTTSSDEQNLARFIDNKNGTITDKETGLVWQQNVDDNFKTYIESEQYCNDLDLGNFTDWRMPNINELLSTLDSSLNQPSINDGFMPITNTTTIGYWSSTPNASEPSTVWYLGRQQWFYTYYYNVNSPGPAIRCVRGNVIQGNHFIDNLDGTVTDSSIKLMWKQHQYNEVNDTGSDLKIREWADSSSYCENLSFAGYDDWRLPRIKEIVSLVDYNKYDPAIDQSFFPNVSACCSSYWSSTSVPNDPLSAWTVNIGENGYINSEPKTDHFNYSVCVRDLK